MSSTANLLNNALTFNSDPSTELVRLKPGSATNSVDLKASTVGGPILNFNDDSDATLVKVHASSSNVLNVNNAKITSVGDPTEATDAVNKTYVDQAIQGLHWKESVRFAIQVDVSDPLAFANGVGVVQGGSLEFLATGDRILLYKQNDQTTNGVYLVEASSSRRTDDFDATDGTDPRDVSGYAIFVREGIDADVAFVVSSDTSVVGTDDIVFTPFVGVSNTNAGVALSKTGSTLDVQVDESTVEVNGSNQVQVKDLGITTAKLAANSVATGKIQTNAINTSKIQDSAITTAKIADANVTNAKLENDSVTVTAGDGLQNGGTVALGGSTTIDVDTTVVRTSGDQTVAGVKTVDNHLLFTEITAPTPTTDALYHASGDLYFGDVNLTAGSLPTGTIASVPYFNKTDGTTLLGDSNIILSGVNCDTLTAGNQLIASGTDNSTSISTGAIISSGGIGVANDIVSGGTVTCVQLTTTSDERKKTNIESLSPDDKFDKLNPVKFDWKSNGTSSNGLIAQEVQQLYPECVKEDGEGMLSVDYQQMIALLITEVQQLKKNQ